MEVPAYSAVTGITVCCKAMGCLQAAARCLRLTAAQSMLTAAADGFSNKPKAEHGVLECFTHMVQALVASLTQARQFSHDDAIFPLREVHLSQAFTRPGGPS